MTQAFLFVTLLALLRDKNQGLFIINVGKVASEMAHW